MLKSNRVLLVGTSFSAVPLLMMLKTLGWKVAVCGNHPLDPCVAMADEYFELDYSNADQLLTLVKHHGFQFLCPSCNDYAYLSAAYVADRLGLPGFDQPANVEIISNKACFRAFAEKECLPIPRVWHDYDDHNEIEFPVLVKPVDSFSGRGVHKVTQRTDLVQAIIEATRESRSGSYVIEQFIEGSLHSHSAFVRAGNIALDFFVDEFCQAYAYQVDCSSHPSRLAMQVRNQVRAIILDMIKALELVDGLLHTQFMFGSQGPILIESMRRCPGDLYYHLINFSTGQPYILHYLAPFLGLQDEFVPSVEESYWMRHTLSQSSEKIFSSVNTQLAGLKNLRLFPLAEVGSTIKAAPFGKAAIAFLEVDGLFELERQTPCLADRFIGSFHDFCTN